MSSESFDDVDVDVDTEEDFDIEEDFDDTWHDNRQKRRSKAKNKNKKSGDGKGPKPRARARRKLSRQASDSYDHIGESFEYTQQLNEFVVRKYYDVMDPIFCVKNSTVAGQVGSYCWVDAGTTSDDDTRLGGYFFPIIQHRNPACSWCKKGSYSAKKCNVYDMEFVLLFHAANPAKAYYAQFNNSNHYHYDFGDVSAATHPELSWDWTKSGFTGFLKVNLYSGVKYLNELLYKLPDTQCTTPVALAADTTSTLACGQNPSRKHLRHGKGVNKYCKVPPESPVQMFLECKYTTYACFNSALAAAQANAALVAVVAGYFMSNIGQRLMGAVNAPTEKKEPDKLWPWQRASSVNV